MLTHPLPNKSPWVLFFLILLLFSYAVVLTAPNIFLAWVGMELNLYAFTPLLNSSSPTRSSTKPAITYLIIQAIGSSLFILWVLAPPAPLLALMALALKMGAAPLHFWLPTVSRYIPWASIWLLLTLQKLPPLFLILAWQEALVPVNSLSLPAISSLIIVSALIGSMLGLIQTEPRLLLTYSSVAQMGWLLWTALASQLICLSYFLVYSMVMLSLCLTFSSASMATSKPSNAIAFKSLKLQLLAALLFISLAGLPPMPFFIMKYATIITLTSSTWLTPFTAFCLLLSSAINTFFYLNFFIPMNTHFPHIQPTPAPLAKAPSLLSLLSIMPIISPVALLFIPS